MKKLFSMILGGIERVRLWLGANRDKIEYVDGLLFSNPVLIEGLALAPAVVATQSLKAAVILSVGFIWLVVLDVVIVRFAFSKASEEMRTIACALIGAVLFVPMAYTLKLVFPFLSTEVGLYLPIMIVDSVILSKSELYIELHHSNFRMFMELLFHSLGFILVVCLLGAAREVLAYGTIWGITVNAAPISSSVALPFFGFFMVAVLAAAAKALTNHFYHWINKRPAQAASRQEVNGNE